jgi:hypothetical protein
VTEVVCAFQAKAFRGAVRTQIGFLFSNLEILLKTPFPFLKGLSSRYYM